MNASRAERLKNKVAIVTGAADGIGLAISQLFSEHGAKVIMADVSLEKAINESSTIKWSRAIHCDVGNSESVKSLIDAVIKDYGQIDVLVNNAAIAIPGNILDMPEENWDKTMNVNLKSAFRTIQHCLPHMLKHKQGSVINMSSAQAMRSWHNWTAYAAAKGALMSMTNQLAGQFGEHNIRFNSISPGAIFTPLNQARIEKEGDGFLHKSINMSPAKRMGEANEVAMTALFLASDEATFINGTDIKVDGGLCAVPRYDEDDNDN